MKLNMFKKVELGIGAAFAVASGLAVMLGGMTEQIGGLVGVFAIFAVYGLVVTGFTEDGMAAYAKKQKSQA